jgi:hypothetical protein
MCEVHGWAEQPLTPCDPVDNEGAVVKKELEIEGGKNAACLTIVFMVMNHRLVDALPESTVSGPDDLQDSRTVTIQSVIRRTAEHRVTLDLREPKGRRDPVHDYIQQAALDWVGRWVSARRNQSSRDVLL